MRYLALILSLLFAFNPAVAEEEEGEAAAPAEEYIALKPDLTVNLLGKRHYLRTSIQLLAEGDNIDIVKNNLPAIRHALIMELSNLEHEKLLDIKKREKIRKAAVKSAQEKVQSLNNGKGEIKDLYFTTFLVQ